MNAKDKKVTSKPVKKVGRVKKGKTQPRTRGAKRIGATPETEALARHFASAPTLGLARTKQALQASGLNTLEQQLDLERDGMRELGRSADYREGVAAFLEKRAPRFVGA